MQKSKKGIKYCPLKAEWRNSTPTSRLTFDLPGQELKMKSLFIPSSDEVTPNIDNFKNILRFLKC